MAVDGTQTYVTHSGFASRGKTPPGPLSTGRCAPAARHASPQCFVLS